MANGQYVPNSHNNRAGLPAAGLVVLVVVVLIVVGVIIIVAAAAAAASAVVCWSWDPAVPLQG